MSEQSATITRDAPPKQTRVRHLYEGYVDVGVEAGHPSLCGVARAGRPHRDEWDWHVEPNRCVVCLEIARAKGYL